jgi:hypothetical protein
MHLKLENFPSVNYISLYESTDRRDFMECQMKYFGIKRVNRYLTERFINLHDIEITGYYTDTVLHLGTIVSQLNLMRNWYNSCNDPYAIFCEDDISFESINYWNFTWNEFVENLPNDWGCVQLMRIVSPWHDNAEQELQIDLRSGRWWSICRYNELRHMMRANKCAARTQPPKPTPQPNYPNSTLSKRTAQHAVL